MSYKDPEKQQDYQQTHYESNKDLYKKRATASRRRSKDVINKLKEVPCVDCKNQFPHYVMQFDHIKNNKVASVSKLVRERGLKYAIAEVAKCEVVCANCHAIRTWNRIQ